MKKTMKPKSNSLKSFDRVLKAALEQKRKEKLRQKTLTVQQKLLQLTVSQKPDSITVEGFDELRMTSEYASKD